MNENLPPQFVEPVVPPGNAEIVPPVRLGRLLLGLGLSVALFDACFWGINFPGFSVGVFFVVLAGIIMGNREAGKGTLTARVLLLLLAGGALAGAIETGFSNVLVMMVLIIALAGVTYFREVESLWGRVLSQVVTLALAPGRVFWLTGVVLETAVKNGVGGMSSLVGGCLLAMPALVLALVFGSLLATGNAVFSNWTGSFFDWLGKELALYLDLGRIVLWFFVALAILPLLRPANVQSWWWSWTQRLPRLPELVPTRAALYSSGLILVVLNLLFFVANLADVLFLWSGQTVPKGVTYSEFVHSGTNALTWTVLLSAVVLTGIFQQALPVAQRRELKGLALFWIAQNLFLLLSVGLRLKFYIEAYDMTVLRLSVIIFLVLVAMGYGLLTVKIVQERSLSWLVGGCMLAVLAAFYVTQFLNLGGWSAQYNVARWEKDRSRNLDLPYIISLGAAGWPALRQATDDGAAGDVLADSNDFAGRPIELARHSEAEHPGARFDMTHWREFSLRAWWNRGALEEKKAD